MKQQMRFLIVTESRISAELFVRTIKSAYWDTNMPTCIIANQYCTFLANYDSVDLMFCDRECWQWALDARLNTLSVTPLLIVMSDTYDSSDCTYYLSNYADDYMVYNIDPYVLRARLNSLFRRGTFGSVPVAYSYHELSVNCSERSVVLSNRSLTLTPSEFGLLALLIANAETIVPYNALLASLLHHNATTSEAVLHVFLYHIRKKLNKASNGQCHLRIKTIHKVGVLLSCVPS